MTAPTSSAKIIWSLLNFFIPPPFYSGCQKNVPVFKRFFLQPLMPHFRISEHYYGKRYNSAIFTLWNSTLGGAAKSSIPQGGSAIRNS